MTKHQLLLAARLHVLAQAANYDFSTAKTDDQLKVAGMSAAMAEVELNRLGHLGRDLLCIEDCIEAAKEAA